MPEQHIARSKYNFNKHQKDKQNKIMQYYRRSFKYQLAPVREITRPKRTRKQHFQSNPSTSKLTKTHTLESQRGKDKETEEDKQKEQEKKEQEKKEQHEKEEQQKQKINLEKSEKSPTQKGGENQYVIMD